MNFRIFFYFYKKYHWNFDKNSIESVYLGSVDILTTLNLPIHDHGISFHLFVSSIFFINVL